MAVRALGLDISLGHGAITLTSNRAVKNWWYYSEKAGHAKASKHGTLLPYKKSKKDDPELIAIQRIHWIYCWISRVIKVAAADCAMIEAYAHGKTNQAHQIGEGGAAAKLALWRSGVPFRSIPPTSLKMFATHDGSADKALMEDASKDRWGVDFSRENGSISDRTVSEDLADSTALSVLAATEWMLRSGALLLKDLEHDKERRVFLETSKIRTVNILGRDWICRKKD